MVSVTCASHVQLGQQDICTIVPKNMGAVEGGLLAKGASLSERQEMLWGHLRLLFKALPLHRRVVQLCVGVAQLPLVDKQLKALRHARQGAMPACTTIKALE